MNRDDWYAMACGDKEILDENHVVICVPTGWIVETFVYDRDRYGQGSGDTKHMASVFVPNQEEM